MDRGFSLLHHHGFPDTASRRPALPHIYNYPHRCLISIMPLNCSSKPYRTLSLSHTHSLILFVFRTILLFRPIPRKIRHPPRLHLEQNLRRHTANDLDRIQARHILVQPLPLGDPALARVRQAYDAVEIRRCAVLHLVRVADVPDEFFAIGTAFVEECALGLDYGADHAGAGAAHAEACAGRDGNGAREVGGHGGGLKAEGGLEQLLYLLYTGG